MPGFTRQIILHTLTELMNEKPLSKITVKDIVERCGVNRNTFYYHFRAIPDAVEEMVKVVKRYTPNEKNRELYEDAYRVWKSIFQDLHQHANKNIAEFQDKYRDF